MPYYHAVPLPIADGGTNAVTAAAAATNLGLGTGDSPQFAAVNIGHATDSTLARLAAGQLGVEGKALARIGSSVKAYAGSVQALTAGAWATIQFNTETEDSLSEFNTTTYTFTPGSTGDYLITVACQTVNGPQETILGVWTGTSAELIRLADVGGAYGAIGTSVAVSLTASTGYTFRVYIVTINSDTVSGAAFTHLEIKRLY